MKLIRDLGAWAIPRNLPRVIAFALLSAVVTLLIYLRFFPDHACRSLHREELAQLRAVAAAVGEFRSKHGRLPNSYPDLELPVEGLDHAALHGYRELDGEDFEIHYVSFDGPAISYSSAEGQFRCTL